MANVRLILSPLTIVPTATSVDSNWPVTNLMILMNLAKKWAASVSTGIVDVTFDLGSGNTFSGLAADPGIFFDDVNVISIKIQANTSPSWVSPPWDQGVTITKHRSTGRYKGFWRLADLNPAAVNYRYINMRILSQTPTDGANYRMGRVVLGHVTDLAANPNYGMTYERARRTIHTDMEDGGIETNLMGPPYDMVTFQHTLSGATARDEHWDIEAIGEGQPFVLWDASEGASHDAWLLARLDPSRLTKEYNLYYKTQRVYRELI